MNFRLTLDSAANSEVSGTNNSILRNTWHSTFSYQTRQIS